ncbi:CCB3/YggT [Methylophilaceae bacterium]
MLLNALLFLVHTLLSLLSALFLLRFYFQLCKVSFQNPAAEWVLVLSQFAVKPTRRILSVFKNFGLSRVDLSTLLLTYLSQLTLFSLTLWLKDFPLIVAGSQIWPSLLGLAMLGVVNISLTIFLYAVLLQAVLSWLNPLTALAPLLDSLTAPILTKMRLFIRPIGHIDISPLIFVIGAQLVLATLLIPLENHLLANL